MEKGKERSCRVGASGNLFFHFKHCTQFCITGLQKSSSRNPKCTKTLGGWALQKPHGALEVYSASPSPLGGG